MRPLPLILGLAVLALPALSSAQTAPQKEPPEPRNLCTHATGWAAGCPSASASPTGWSPQGEKRRAERLQVLDRVNAAILSGHCEDARRIAVDKGEHELADRVRKVCKG